MLVEFCQAQKGICILEYSGINDALYQWYKFAVKRNLFPDRGLLVEKAREIADCLGHSIKRLVALLAQHNADVFGKPFQTGLFSECHCFQVLPVVFFLFSIIHSSKKQTMI